MQLLQCSWCLPLYLLTLLQIQVAKQIQTIPLYMCPGACCSFHSNVRFKDAFLAPCPLAEHDQQAFNPGVQGGSGAEVPLHPAPLQCVQSPVGLAHPAGDLLRGCHRALQRQLHALRRYGHGRALHHRERHRGGNALHHRWGRLLWINRLGIRFLLRHSTNRKGQVIFHVVSFVFLSYNMSCSWHLWQQRPPPPRQFPSLLETSVSLVPSGHLRSFLGTPGTNLQRDIPEGWSEGVET